MNRQRSSSLYNRKLAALAVILLALAVVFWMVMRYSRSHMIRLAELEFVRVQNLQQPSSPSPSLEHGIQAFHDGNYSSALISLGQHLQEHPDSYFGSFYSGLARIKSAPLQILGVTLAFDPEAVRLALRDMQNARKTAANPRQTANCLWFAARSHLMLWPAAGGAQSVAGNS
ncbi:MAG: hypothetical protein U5R06_09440 [candidate division KSB1 bacterium]|nr:hypothetical protein [candidate division KSB1 bacterium]